MSTNYTNQRDQITFPPKTPADQPGKRVKPVWKVLGVGGLTLTAFLIGIGAGGASGAAKDGAASQMNPQPAVTQTVQVPGPAITKTVPGPETTKTVEVAPPPPPAAAGPATTITEPGVYLVGKDIAPGKYRTDGGGYFAVLKDATAPTDDTDNILTNDNPRGQAFVTLKAGQGFETKGDMTWTKVG